MHFPDGTNIYSETPLFAAGVKELKTQKQNNRFRIDSRTDRRIPPVGNGHATEAASTQIEPFQKNPPTRHGGRCLQ